MAGERTDGPGATRSSPGDGLRDAARETIDTMRQEASGIAGHATEQGRTLLSRQKDAAAEHLDSVARALQGSAQGLEREEPAAGRYVGYAAQRLQSMGRQLRDKDLDALVDDVQDLGRRAPGTFFAGSVVAGFLMARFLKSSSDRAAGTSWSGFDASSRPTGATHDGPGGRGEDLDLRGTRGGAAGAGGFGGTSPQARESGDPHGR